MSTLDENVKARTPGDPGDTFFTPTIDVRSHSSFSLSKFLMSSQPRSKDNTRKFPLDGIDLKSVSNADLIQLVNTAPLLYQIGESKVLRISRNLVLKCSPNVQSGEVKALELLEAKTRISVSHIHRSFFINDSSHFGTTGYIVMDYVDGLDLGYNWKTLTSQQKIDVVRQTVDIITQLQALVIPTPGPLGGGTCTGRFFTEFGAGPFKSGSEMADWFNHKLRICKRFNKTSKDIPPFQFTEFVLVHQDISPRNMILDASGRVWLIDWADAGAYPPAFERAALVEQYRFPEFNQSNGAVSYSKV